MTQPSRHGEGAHEGDVRTFVERRGAALSIGQIETCLARAPGRLDLMGGIADYSGSLVLQMPIAEATICAAQQREDDTIVIESSLTAATPSSDGQARRYATSLARVRELAASGYDAARHELSAETAEAWASYPLGTLIVLMRERSLELGRGLRLLIESSVPEGKGVSSSAALEVATLLAIAGIHGVTIEGSEVAHLCQIAENRVVGAPCGIMDQMASALGARNRLLALRCQPAELLGHVTIPPELGVWGIDSGVRHAVTGSSYGDVRVGTFMGYRILAELAGLETEPGPSPGLVRIEDPRWHGYLANVDPQEFARDFANRIPESIDGATFLERYGGVSDDVAAVDPRVTYAVRQPTLHPIDENRRVERFAELLASEPDEATKRELGQLMFESHASYTRCGLGSSATDRIVELVRDAGPQSGLYGAKITGGGSGGTVAILGRADAEAVVHDIATRHATERDGDAYVFCSSSPGAMEHGTLLI